MNPSVPGDILVVDDVPANLKLLTELLTRRGHRVRPASSGRLALRSVEASVPDLVLLDIRMPELDGYEVCRQLKAEASTRDVPVIFISALDDSADVVRAFEAGGVDYVCKPFRPEEVLARVETQLALGRLRANLATQNDLLQTEIAERKRVQQALTEHEAHLEALVVQRTAALRESEALYRSVLENFQDVYYRTDTAGRLVLASPSAARMLGYEHASDLYGKGVAENFYLEPGTRTRLLDAIREGGGAVTNFEVALRTRDGRPIFVSTNSHLYRNARGEVAGVEGVFRDITDRRSAEQALRESEEKYRSLITNLNVGIYRNTVDGRFLQANPALARMLGFESVEALLSVPVSSVFEDPAQRQAMLEQLQNLGALKDYELRLRRRDGSTLWASMSAAVQHDEVGKMKWVEGVVEETTQRKQLEEQLRQAQKMEAVGTLAGGIAHDFNNILTAIMGYGSLLRLDLPDESSASRLVDDIVTASERAANLTQRLLAFSRKQVMVRRPVDLNEVVRQVERLLGRIIGEDVEFHIELTGERLPVHADPGQLEQVLMNLASNARDAMPRGGRLTITTTPVPAPTHGSGKWARISVADTGVGIDEATREHIFEPFFTTKEPGRGTGLGLSIVYGIMQQHEGEIRVHSEPGRGTVFEIFLPLLETRAAAGPVAPPPAPVGGSETILVAEDDPSVRAFVVQLLSQFGYTVVQAENGDEAVERFRQRPTIDLVLCDVVMPKRNAMEATHAMRGIRADVRVLFSSGYTADVLEAKGLWEPGIPLISKPVPPRVLLAQIREVLEERSSRSGG